MDPQQQQALNQISSMGAGILAFTLLFSLILTLFFVWLFWRIFTKAGMSGALSLLTLIPGVGFIIVLCMLACSRWNVVPVPAGYAAADAPYPASTYPPPSYPPAGPPSQL